MIGYEAPRPFVPLPARLAVLLSGRGSNFEALADGCEREDIPGKIVLVASDNAGAEGLGRAERRGISSKVIMGGTREEREASLLEALDSSRTDLICLAGFMRLLSPAFVGRYPLRILNIHPSLLPAFPGLEAQAQALACGVRVTGATVHFVDAGTDSGPIVDQRAVPLLAGDDAGSLAARILPIEHELYVSSVSRVLRGGWRLEGRRVSFSDET